MGLGPLRSIDFNYYVVMAGGVGASLRARHSSHIAFYITNIIHKSMVVKTCQVSIYL